MSARSGSVLMIVAGVVIAATVVASIALVGTPGQQRLARLDAKRVNDLVRIENRVDEHVKQHGALPVDLDALASGDDRTLPRADSDGVAYRYEPLDVRRYRLCARFATDSRERLRQADPWAGEQWRHPVGEHCFERKAGAGNAAADRAADAAAAAVVED